VVYTSRLTRAIKSTWHLLLEIDALYTPVFKTYRLNQRSYGSLEGLSKTQTAKEFGTEVVQAWRNSLKARPPPADWNDPNFAGNDRRYSDLPADRIPVTESLLDCQERARPLWEHKIRKDIKQGKTVVVVAHRDTLRGLVKVIDGISDKDISKVSIPTGIPFVYRFDRKMKPVKPADESLIQAHTNSSFLEKPGLLDKALKRQEQWANLVPGFEDPHEIVRRGSTMEETLAKLRKEQNLFKKLDEDSQMHADREKSDDFVSKNLERWSDDPGEFEEYDFFASEEPENIPVTVEPLANKEADLPVSRDGPFVVLIRHGRTPHNNLGLFTGRSTGMACNI